MTKRDGMTKAQREALRWFRMQLGPVGWFDATAPSQRMRSILEQRGWIAKERQESAIALVRFAITPAGRAALANAEKR